MRRHCRFPILQAVALACLLAGVPSRPGLSQGAAFEDNASREEIERFLRTARVTRSKLISSGVTLPRKLTLTDGTTERAGIFKTIDEHKPGVTQLSTGSGEVDFKDSWKYEVAAYELDKLLGVGLVPVTVEREHGQERGSLQLWIENTMSEKERVRRKLSPPDAESWNGQMFKLRLFDNLIFNFDRHLGNVLIDPDWRIYLIDNSRAFKKFGDLKSPEGLTRFSRSLMESLEQLEPGAVKEKCGRYLSVFEIEGLWARRDKILELYRRLVAEKGNVVTYP